MTRILLFATILSGAALAQEFPATNGRSENNQVIMTYGPPRPGPVVAGAPYSAEQVQEYNGNRSVIGRFARDSNGRLRTEKAFKFGPSWLTTIYDPVAGVAYLLDDDAKVAHRMALPPYDPATARAPFVRPTDESLGEQSVDGLRLTGHRRSGPLTMEVWRSEDLQLDVITRSSNGYSGRLDKLSRAEPDAALFRPPVGYRVVDEPAPFTLAFRGR